MNLIVFDIDGTLVDSVEADDECFIQAFQDLYGVDLVGADWNDYKHVTDSGLSTEIFQKHFDRKPLDKENVALKEHFYKLLDARKAEFVPIDGARNTLKYLTEHPDMVVAFATGGWKETAALKLSRLGVDIDELVIATANDHISRAEITQLAIEKAQANNGISAFNSITYMGDGLWDFQTARDMGINFIGVDYHKNNKLKNVGAENVIRDLTDTSQIIQWVIGEVSQGNFQ